MTSHLLPSIRLTLLSLSCSSVVQAAALKGEPASRQVFHQASYVASQHGAALILVALAAAVVAVLALAMCGSRTQQLNINESEERQPSRLAWCWPKVVNNNPSEVAKGSHAERGSSRTQNLATDPVLIAEKPASSSNDGDGGKITPSSRAHSQSTGDLAQAVSVVKPDADNSSPSPKESLPSSFLRKQFASFSELHSMWRNKSEPKLDSRMKGVSKSLEDLDVQDHDKAAKKTVKSKPPRPPPTRLKSWSSSNPDTSEESAGITVLHVPGYEDIEIITTRPAKHKRVPVSQTSASGDSKAYRKEDHGHRKTSHPSSGGGLKRFVLSSSVPTRTGPESEDITPVDPGTPNGADSPSSDELGGSKGRSAPRIELAYDLVTVPVKSPPSPELDARPQMADQAYAVSNPLKSPLKALKKTRSEDGDGQQKGQVASTNLVIPASPGGAQKRSLPNGRVVKKHTTKAAQPAVAPLASASQPVPDTTYERIAVLPGDASAMVAIRRSTEELPRFGESSGRAVQRATADSDNDYEELADVPKEKKQSEQQKLPKPKDLYSVVDKKQAPRTLAAAPAPAPTDLYSVVDKKTGHPPAAPTDLYSVVDRKTGHPPAPTDLYSLVDKKQDGQLVYTKVAFGEAEEGATASKKSALPAPATVYEHIDIDVQPGATKLPQRRAAGYREDDSDYEEIPGANNFGSAL